MIKRLLRLVSVPLDAMDQGASPLIWALAGAGLGLTWAVAARFWMYLIAPDPTFTWTGTLAIVIIALIFGTCAGFAYAARRRGWTGWRHYGPRVAVLVTFIPFALGGGAPMMINAWLATLVLTQPGNYAIWIPTMIAAALGLASGSTASHGLILPIAVIAITVWKWVVRSSRTHNRVQQVDPWVDRIVQATTALLAAAMVIFVAREIFHEKPGPFSTLYVIYYIFLLYPLVVGLRVGFAPKHSGAR